MLGEIAAYAKQRQVVLALADAAERLGRPQGLPARKTKRAEGIRIGKLRDDAGGKTRAQPKIAHGCVGLMADRDDASAVLLAQALDLAKAQAQRVRAQDVLRHLAMTRMHAGRRMRVRLEGGVPVRAVDVGR